MTTRRNGKNLKIDQALDLLKKASREKQAEFADMVSGLLESIKESGSQAAERARDVAERIDETAHKKPWRLIGLAAVSGALLGWIIKSRR